MSEAISFEEPWARTHQFDPPAVFDALRAERPLSRMVYPDGHVGWIVSSHELVRKVLGDPRFSHSTEIGHFPVTHQGQLVPTHPSIPGMFIHMDPPDHTRYRRLLTGEFTVRRAGQLKPRVEQVAAEQVAAMREHGAPADLVQTFARPLVLRLLAELVGLPYEERDQFEHAPTLLHDPDANPEDVAAAYARASALFVEVIERKRGQPGDDLISRVLASDEQLSTDELCNVVLLLLFAGFETTESALTVGVFALLHHTEQLADLRANPSKLDAAVEELLRYLSVNQYHMYRTALEDVELHGEVVKKGDSVTVSVPAANRDPARFGCPAALDIDRDTSGHVAFGFGIHQCLGQNLARVELRAGLAALLGAFPDLALAVPFEEVPLRLKGSVFAVKNLPVSW
ncbi:cytochrome P450 [Actinokineospora pegani]|uniref:cytochrome P450 n=1 Tax=Actinokineospora pegani TaxID=2654637 RepID=UPI0012EA935D|nr:cytochrome P450 [Actinokineospora pegani]